MNPEPENDDEPALWFDLAADRLDLDRYLPPVDTGRGGAASDPLARLQDVLAGRDAEGTLRVGTLEIGELRSSDAVLGFHARREAPPADALPAEPERASAQPAVACEASAACVTPAVGAAGAATEQ